MANPHPSLPGTKLVSQEALLRYHHTLIEKLGLVQDTAAYKYNGEREDFPQDEINSVGEALDKLYDMAKEGALTFGSGKAENATLDDVVFDTKDGEDSNLYWIHAQVGDDIVNIQLNADAFIKDSVLDSVVLVNLSTVEGEKIYKVNGTEAVYSTETIAGKEVSVLTVGENKYYGFDEENDGTYFHYTWRIDEGKKGVGYTFTTISLKDVYGDLHDDGKGYVHYDKDTAEISVDTADVIGTDVVVDEETGETKKTWSVDSEDENNLATAENLTEVAQDLQDQIDELENKNELKDGEVSFSTEATSMTAQVSEEGSYYKLNLQIMSDDEIDGLFSVCSTDPTAEELAKLGEDANVSVAADKANLFADSNKTYNQINIG